MTFSWPPNDNGGSTAGDTFVTWIPSDSSDRSEQQRRTRGTGLSSETSFVRFGPNLSSDRLDEQRLAEHETRHLDQWAVFSVAGGPLAFPLAYWADSLLFPGSRSHFERDAGLAEGGYRTRRHRPSAVVGSADSPAGGTAAAGSQPRVAPDARRRPCGTG